MKLLLNVEKFDDSIFPFPKINPFPTTNKKKCQIGTTTSLPSHRVRTGTSSEENMKKFFEIITENNKKILSFQKTVPVETRDVETQTEA